MGLCLIKRNYCFDRNENPLDQRVFEIFPLDIDEGSLLENCVFNSLRKFGKINYYQKRSSAEIKIKGIQIERERLVKIGRQINLKESYLISKNFIDQPGFIPATDI